MHADLRHAWLELPAALATEMLGDQISKFSFISDDKSTIYLEDHVDAPAFLKKLQENGITHEIVEHWHDDDCFIRSLSSYKQKERHN